MTDLFRGAAPTLVGIVAAGLVLVALAACSASTGRGDAATASPVTRAVETTSPPADAATPEIETATFALG